MAAAGWIFAERGSKLAEAAQLSIVVLPFANLLSNAVKFTRIRKRAEIEIGCVDGSDDQGELLIRDNGRGV
jgi:K+-sensing histidine kinase KdpD